MLSWHRTVRGLLWVIDFDRRHHTSIFMFNNMTVIHKAPEDDGIGKRDDDLDFTADRNDIVVSMSRKFYRFTIDFNNLEIHLVNMKLM